MRPRILLRTHYEADEPRLIIATVVARCSSPTETRTEDNIAAALEKWARANGYTISTPGAIYAVSNARHLGLLNNSNRWTASGLALAFFARVMPPESGFQSRLLTPAEQRLYLKLYLEEAGALLIIFAQWLLEHGTATHSQLRADATIEKLLVEAHDEYLSLATEARDRSAIRRERERLSRAGYTAATKRHKRYPLLTTMARLNLLQEHEEGTILPDLQGRLASMSRTIPNVQALERLIRANKLQESLDIEMHEYERKDFLVDQKPISLLLSGYSFAMDLGIQACPISFLNHLLNAFFPASPLKPSLSTEAILEPLHKAQPGEVRFHVDRKGQRAFVLISEKAIKYLIAGLDQT